MIFESGFILAILVILSFASIPTAYVVYTNTDTSNVIGFEEIKESTEIIERTIETSDVSQVTNVNTAQTESKTTEKESAKEERGETPQTQRSSFSSGGGGGGGSPAPTSSRGNGPSWTITVLYPNSGETLSGTLWINTTTTGNADYDYVKFYLYDRQDTTYLGNSTQPEGTNWVLNWNTSEVDDGNYKIYVEYYGIVDTKNTKLATDYSDDWFTIDNEEDKEEECSVSVKAIPGGGEVVVRAIDIIANVTKQGSCTVEKVRFDYLWKGNYYPPVGLEIYTYIGEDTSNSEGWSIEWNTTTVPDGRYKARTRVYVNGTQVASDLSDDWFRVNNSYRPAPKSNYTLGNNTTLIRDDDEEMDTYLILDYGDDEAIKYLNVNNLNNYTGARLWIYAKNLGCGLPEEAQYLTVNGQNTIYYDPCDNFYSTFSWQYFTIPIDWLVDGQNSFKLKDTNHWSQNDLKIGVDQDNDYGRSIISENTWSPHNRPPDSISGELMIFLELLGHPKPESNQPPRAEFNWTPITPEPSEIIQFTDLSTDSDGTIASWYWIFGDGSFSTEQNPQYNYSSEGTYQVWLRVTDNERATNNVSHSITVTKEEQNQPPVIAWISATPPNGTAPLNVTFSGSASDSDGYIVYYSWDFGDGYNSTLINTTHLYTINGSYTATLTVWDNEGATATKNITLKVF